MAANIKTLYQPAAFLDESNGDPDSLDEEEKDEEDDEEDYSCCDAWRRQNEVTDYTL